MEGVLLKCSACSKDFAPTHSQEKNQKLGAKYRFCSKECQNSVQNKHLCKPLSGPCPTCGDMFKSRGTAKKTFCTMKCYVASAGFKKMAAENCLNNAAKAMGNPPEGYTPLYKTCIECGTEYKSKPSRTSKYCNSMCYRKYMTKRFDRWIASPQKIALPQAFDEFLTADILHCLVDGCDWKGHHLSMHMNQTHGVIAKNFKKLAGFNLGSGIVSAPLHEAYCERDHVGIATDNSRFPQFTTGMQQKKTQYRSLEGKEHRAKTNALKNDTEEKPLRVCTGCRVEFRQSSHFGRKLFHSIECRNAYYRTHKKPVPRKNKLSCVACGSGFFGTNEQQKNANNGIGVCCSYRCSGVLAGNVHKAKCDAARVALKVCDKEMNT